MSLRIQGKMKILATGIDTLEVGYEVEGFKDPLYFQLLQLLKSEAQINNKELPIGLPGREFSLSYKTPLRYDYYLTDGRVQITINTRFKKPRDYPEVHVKYLSSYLWTSGIKTAIAETDELINDLFEVTNQKISRADFSVDVEFPLPETKFEQFVGRLRTKKDYTISQTQREYINNLDMNDITPEKLKELLFKMKIKNTTVFQSNAIGINNTGFTLGTSDTILVQYPKDFEIKQTGKTYFLPIWESAGRSFNSDVTRTEIRCNRDFLRHWTINTTTDLLEHQSSLWKHLTNKHIRICQPKKDVRRERWDNTPLWETISLADFNSYKGLQQSPDNKWNRDRALTMLRGYMLNIEAHGRYQGEDILETIANIHKNPDYGDELIRRFSMYPH